MKLFFLSVITVLSSLFFFVDKDLERARAYFDVRDYVHAVYYYERLTKVSDTSDIRKLADSYVALSRPEMALPFYKRLTGRNSSAPVLAHTLSYVNCLRSLGKYDVALFNLKKVKNHTVYSQQLISSLDSVISWSTLQQVDKVKNLKNVNTSFNEMAPVIFNDGLLFCSDRERMIIRKKDATTNNPVYNLWLSNDLKKPQRWSSTLNTLQQDGPCSFTEDYEKVYMSKTILSGNEQEHKPRLFTAEKLSIRWGDKKEFVFNDTLNTFTQPFITKDEHILFFVSDMPGGLGGLDIYACFNYEGRWTDPINVGAPINTPGNEIFPFLSEQGDLFFSSDYHIGFGGYDIFKSEQINGAFKKVENLKKPINSSRNDFSYVSDSSGVNVFFTSDRPGGEGLDDIYKVE